MADRKVYIVNKGAYDYSAAAEFGELVFLTQGVVNTLRPSDVIVDLYEKLRDSSPDDLIVPVGTSTLNMLVGCLFASIHTKVNLLLYNQDKEYQVRSLDLGGLISGL